LAFNLPREIDMAKRTWSRYRAQVFSIVAWDAFELGIPRKTYSEAMEDARQLIKTHGSKHAAILGFHITKKEWLIIREFKRPPRR
jgi:hypothetical protein